MVLKYVRQTNAFRENALNGLGLWKRSTSTIALAVHRLRLSPWLSSSSTADAISRSVIGSTCQISRHAVAHAIPAGQPMPTTLATSVGTSFTDNFSKDEVSLMLPIQCALAKGQGAEGNLVAVEMNRGGEGERDRFRERYYDGLDGRFTAAHRLCIIRSIGLHPLAYLGYDGFGGLSKRSAR